MPVYCYRCDHCRRTVQEFLHARQARRARMPRCASCGQKMHRDYQAEFGKPRACGKWPIYSDAMAVHPSQIADAKRQADELGVPTKFVERDCPEADKWAGQPIFTSQRHQDEYLRKVTGGKLVNLDKYG